MPKEAAETLFTVRSYVPEDKAFIMATFLRGLYYGFKDKQNQSDSWFGLIPKNIFMANYKNVIENLIASPKTLVLVACLKSDPDFIVGYSVVSSDFSTVHWVHVKNTERRSGVARMLLPSNPTAVSHLSRLGLDLLPKLNSPIFNPFITL
jgi:hypothetical protein